MQYVLSRPPWPRLSKNGEKKNLRFIHPLQYGRKTKPFLILQADPPRILISFFRSYHT